jgi:AraC-like DNA-binding protein
MAASMSNDQPAGASRVEPERWAHLTGWFVVRVIEDLRDQGVDVRPTLARFDIDAASLRKDSLVDFTRATEWTESVLEQHWRPGLGLRFGSGIQLADLGMVGYTFLSADTFGEMVSLWLRFGSLTRPYQGTAIEFLDDDRMEMTAIERDPPIYGPLMRQYCNERWLAAWAQLANNALGRGRHLDEVHCAYSNPGAHDAYLDAFGCLIRFDQPRTMLRFAPHVRSANTCHANRDARQLCETQCELLLSQMRASQGTTTAVRRLLLSHPSRLPDLATAAQALGTSEATLRRRLSDEGATYTSVLHDVRMQLAVDYLRRTPLRVSEIASVLGYADESAFNRAFKRDHGQTALAFRRTQPGS